MNTLGMWPFYATRREPPLCSPTSPLHIDDLKTGDILLCKNAHSDSWFLSIYESLIRTVTHSPYSHVAMVVRDPTWVDQKGLYVLESALESEPDAESHEQKIGVQTTKLSTLADGSCEIMIRQLMKGTISSQQLEEVHDKTQGKSYDGNPTHLVEAALQIHSSEQRTDAFICSAFLGFMFVQFGFLDADLDFAICLPAQFSSDSDALPWTDTVEYSKDTLLEIQNDE